MHNFVIISGSHRTHGVSHGVAQSLGALIAETLPESTAEIISIADLPFWDEGRWGDPALAGKWDAWTTLAQRLRDADGLVVVSPEYGGMVPPRLSNFLLLCSGLEVGHKPALAVAVSSTRGGAYPIAQLRSHGSKNNYLCWLPDHLILRDLKMDDTPRVLFSDDYTGRYARYCLGLLNVYARAMKEVRASGVIDHVNFPYGM